MRAGVSARSFLGPRTPHLPAVQLVSRVAPNVTVTLGSLISGAVTSNPKGKNAMAWQTSSQATSLATGKPVVISPLPEYEPMRDVLRIARTRDDFIRLVEEALHDTDPATAANRQAAVASGTWDARAEWVSGLIERVLKKSV